MDGKLCRETGLKATAASDKLIESNNAIISDSNYTVNTWTSIEAFFKDDVNIPYQPPPPHSLKQSPCLDIIGKEGEFYYCKLHPNIQYIHLETMEHHIKYKEPIMHKNAITSLGSTGYEDGHILGLRYR